MKRIDDPRFTGAGLVYALFALGCVVLGGVLGIVLSKAFVS